jgi:protein O-GlcNAc transferase
MTTADALHRAMQQHQAGQLSEAEMVYRQVLTEHPDHPDALHLLGLIAHHRGQHAQAAQLIDRAAKLAPTAADLQFNLGLVFAAMNRPDEALAAYRQALKLNPNLERAARNVAAILYNLCRFDEAIAAYHRVLQFAPEAADVHNNLGVAFNRAGKPNQAAASFEKALAARPNDAAILTNLAASLLDMGRLDEALHACRQAVAADPKLVQAYDNLAHVLEAQGEVAQAIACYDRALTIQPNDPVIASKRLFTLQRDPNCDPHTLRVEHERWSHQHARPLFSNRKFQISNLQPRRRLRVGYVSADFCDHAVGRNLLPLLRHRDRENFQVHCYSGTLRPDAMTAKLREQTDAWRDILGRSDDQVADQIDILVDLSLHSAGHRLLIFARKPAPVQVTYLGYCGTTGLDAIDYRLSDPYIDPPDADLSQYTEKTWRLPHTFWCYQPPQDSPPPASATQRLTFGCLNNFAKVSPAAQELWARILKATPGSKLILHSLPGSHLDAVRRRFTSAGVTDDRLEFVGKQGFMPYIATYQRIDIALDPFPYGGGITTCDALWMGVPTVTLCGKTAVGRGGCSILSNIGLSQWVAHSEQEYLKIAVDLAGHPDDLKTLRSTLRQRMLDSPLMDAKAFAGDVETAYREMFQACCQVHA